MTAIERYEAIENQHRRVHPDRRRLSYRDDAEGLVEDRRGSEPDDGIAGSAVRKYAAAFAREASRRPAGSGGPAEAASDPFLAAADDPDPFADSDDD